MHDLAFLDEDVSAQFLGGNFQDGRTARQTFHLQHVRQTDPAQNTTKTFLGLMPRQFIECAVDILPTRARFSFVQDQLSAEAEAGRALAFGGSTA